MNIAQAAEALSDLKKIKLKYWDNDTFLYYDVEHDQIFISIRDNHLSWVPFMDDLTSDEWEIIDENQS